MNARTSQGQFADDLQRLVHRHRLEGQMTYHEVVGVLELQKQLLVLELVKLESQKTRNENPEP